MRGFVEMNVPAKTWGQIVGPMIGRRCSAFGLQFPIDDLNIGLLSA